MNNQMKSIGRIKFENGRVCGLYIRDTKNGPRYYYRARGSFRFLPISANKVEVLRIAEPSM